MNKVVNTAGESEDMNEELIDEVRDFMEKECRKPGSNYGHEPYEYHFKPTVKYAQELSEKMNADKEVVTLAAWLHDVGSIRHGRKNHHETGAEIAENKLRELGYPEEKIEHVAECIRNHRGSVDNERETLEEKIVAEADAMSCFDDIPGLFEVAFRFEDLDREGAKKSIKNKMKRKWSKLHFQESRDIIKPKYEAAMTLLD